MAIRTLRITRLGLQGDGVGESHPTADAQPVAYVPGTAPGDIVRAEMTGDRGRLLEILTEGDDRRAPVCRHFGVCGGCRFQHVGEDVYLAWKTGLLTTALRAQGIEAQPEPIWTAGDRARRRAVFAAGIGETGFSFGFHGFRSHEIVAIEECPLLTPALEQKLPALRSLAQIACTKAHPLTLTVTDCIGGLDVAVAGLPRDLNADVRARLVDSAREAGAARLSLNGEVAAEWRRPVISAGDVMLLPPPGGFLQACANAETQMREHVLAAIGASGPTLDLFSGCGTFSLPLSLTRAVHAVEYDQASLEALKTAVKLAEGAKPVTVEQRDLFRRPLLASEVSRFKSVVIDPPRAGAEAQCRQLAKSRVQRLALISCNPITFARDLKILMEGGYRLGKIWPIDQFRYSAHLEIVASLRR